MVKPVQSGKKVKGGKSVSFKELAYNKIKEMILLQQVVYGEKIFEKDLAEKMRISRTPVREALLILEREKFVENRDRLGFVVRRPRIEEIKDYFDIRKILEAYAAPRIIANLSDKTINALKDNIRQAEECLSVGDIRNFILYNGDFHELLADTTRSAIYCRLISNLNDISTLLRAMSFGNQEGLQDALAGHKKIVVALEAGDAEALKNIFVEHLSQISQKIEQFVFI